MRLQSIGRYNIEGKQLGKGNFATVELAVHSLTKMKVAIKVIDIGKIGEDYIRKNLYREAKLLSHVRHPNIIRLYETMKTSSLYCLCLEYAPVSLLSYVQSLSTGMSEGSCRPYVRQLVSALHHLHQRGVVHRDLKMENIMLSDKRRQIKIIDFGLSNIYTPEHMLQTHCGSPEYAAPELFAERKYGPEIDIWSLGVIIYALVVGKLPFTCPYPEPLRQRKLLQQINAGLSSAHQQEMQHLTSDCTDLIGQCLQPLPNKRISLPLIEAHSWITRGGTQPFYTYREPPSDAEARKAVLYKMSVMLNVNVQNLERAVNEYRCDSSSAIYKMLIDDYLKRHGTIDADHTMRPPPDPKETLTDDDKQPEETPHGKTQIVVPSSQYQPVEENVEVAVNKNRILEILNNPKNKTHNYNEYASSARVKRVERSVKTTPPKRPTQPMPVADMSKNIPPRKNRIAANTTSLKTSVPKKETPSGKDVTSKSPVTTSNRQYSVATFVEINLDGSSRPARQSGQDRSISAPPICAAENKAASHQKLRAELSPAINQLFLSHKRCNDRVVVNSSKIGSQTCSKHASAGTRSGVVGGNRYVVVPTRIESDGRSKNGDRNCKLCLLERKRKEEDDPVLALKNSLRYELKKEPMRTSLSPAEETTIELSPRTLRVPIIEPFREHGVRTPASPKVTPTPKPRARTSSRKTRIADSDPDNSKTPIARPHTTPLPHDCNKGRETVLRKYTAELGQRSAGGRGRGRGRWHMAWQTPEPGQQARSTSQQRRKNTSRCGEISTDTMKKYTKEKASSQSYEFRGSGVDPYSSGQFAIASTLYDKIKHKRSKKLFSRKSEKRTAIIQSKATV